MATGLHTWSTTAASNASADSNVNWSEGQAPSSVNDSARSMMASMAKWRDDTNGSIATGGTSTAFTVTSNQSFASLSAMDNAVIAFIPHTTSGAAPTLAVDGLTAKKIRMVTAVDLPDGVLVSGTPYVVTYEAGVGEFLLHNFAGNPWLVPLGCVLPFFGGTAPNAAFVLPYGQAISRTVYSTLFNIFGTNFGVGDGASTFNIPDLRGRVLAGTDNMGGSAAGRLTSTTLSASDTIGATGGTQTHTLTTAQIPPHTHTGTTGSESASHAHSFPNFPVLTTVTSGGPTNGVPNSSSGGGSGSTSGNDTAHTHTFTSDATGGGGAHANVQPTIVSNYLLRII